MKNSQEKMPYLSDGEIYSIWKYLNGHRLVHRNGGVLNFDDLTASGENRLFVAKFLNLLKDLGIDKLEKLVFHKDLYSKYHGKTLDELKNKKENNSLDTFTLKHFEFLESIINDPDALYENSSGIFNFLFYEGKLGTLEFFEFSDYISPKNRKILADFMGKYITNFIDDSLQKNRANFYCFSKQKEKLIRELFYKEKDYGKSLILEYPRSVDIALGADEEYLFIHTLIALEKLGYLEVDEIWISDMDLPPEKQTEGYKVKLNLKDKFFEEEDEIIYGKIFKKPTAKEQKVKAIDFDETKSILHFDGKEIIISKTRNSNGHYLLKTLFKNKGKIWEFDEIAEDWNDEYEKDGWNRYYNAGYAVNEKIAKETTIKDFLDITNKTVAINKKYL
jgi:hypothetical protein